MKKKIIRIAALTLISALLLTSAVFAAGSSLPFKDVKSGRWYYDPVKYVYENGIMNGMTKNTFEPDGTTTRAQLVTILSRLDNADTKGKGDNTGFSDVPAGKWYSDAIGWASEQDLVNGYSDGTFRPDDPILRQELTVLLSRFIAYRSDNMKNAPIADGFKDGNKIPKWAAAAVEEIRLYGIIAGDDAGNFNPTKTATRAEIATMIMRYNNNIEDPMFSCLTNIYSLAEGDGKSVDIHLLLRERINGSITSFSLSAQILPQLGLSTDVYEIELAKNGLESLIEDTDCNMFFGDDGIYDHNGIPITEDDDNKGISRIRIKNKETGELTPYKTVILNVKRSTGPLVGMDPEEFEPGISPKIYDEMKNIARYSLGDPARYAAFIEKAERGDPVTVAYIGGSITRGASGGPYHNWARLTQNWLEKTFPDSEMTFVNAGIDGTPSYFGNLRLASNVLKHEPDLLFVEFALNDGAPNDANKEAFESMIRRVMNTEKQPAVMILLVGFADRGTCDFMESVADHYGISVADYCAAANYALEQGEIYEKEVAYDGSHPREWGHNFMSQTLVLNFRAIMENLSTASAEDLVIRNIPEERITEARFEDLQSDRPDNYTPVSMDGWEVSDDIYRFDQAWTCTDPSGKLVYEFTGKNLFILTSYANDSEQAGADSDNFLVSVDGGEFVQYGGHYSKVISGDTAETHTVVIMPVEDGGRTVITEFVHN